MVKLLPKTSKYRLYAIMVIRRFLLADFHPYHLFLGGLELAFVARVF